MTINKDRAVLITVIILFIVVSFIFYQSMDRDFLGTDPFMRMVRIEQFTLTGDWYDDIIYDSNAPFGERLHWTKPLDLVILFISLPLRLISQEPIALAGIIVSPLLGGLTLLSLYISVKPLIKNRGLLLIMTLASFQIYQLFGFGRSDHHSLILLIFSVAIGLIIRMVTEKGKGSALVLGIVLGLGMWVSVEFLSVILILFTALMLLFIFNRTYLDEMLIVSNLLTITSFLCLLLEQRMSNLEIVYDSLSLVYIVAFIAMTVVISLIFILYQKFPKYHILYTLALGIAGIFILLMIYPELVLGPFSQVNESIQHIWLSKVGEVQPLISTERRDLGMIFIYLGMTFFSMFIYIIRLIRNKLSDIKIIVLIMIILFTLLTLYQVRWVGYVTLLTLIPATDILTAWIKQIQSSILRVITILAYVLIWLLIGLGILATTDSHNPLPSLELEEVCQVIEAHDMEGVLMTFLDFGPEILYRTDMQVIATPYHRNDQGILFVYDTMAETNQYLIKQMIELRHVDYILIAPDSAERYFYNDGTGSLYSLLKQDRQPDYIKKANLPQEIRDFKLFKVDWDMIKD